MKTSKTNWRMQRWFAGALALPCLLAAMVSMAAVTPSAVKLDNGFVDFTFEDVDIRAFIKLAGEALNRNFVVDRDVDGTVTVLTPRIPLSDVAPLFAAVLESVGCAVVREGPVDRIVRLSHATAALGPVLGHDAALPLEGRVTRVFRLDNVTAADVRRMLEALLSVAGQPPALGVMESTNCLIVTDSVRAMQAIQRLIAEIDRPGLRSRTDVVVLRYVGAEELAAQLNVMGAGADSAAERLRRRLPVVAGQRDDTSRSVLALAIPHSNSVVLMGPDAEVEAMRRLVERIDVAAPDGGGRLHVIFLKYMGAEELAVTLSALLARAAERKTGDGAIPGMLYQAVHIEASAPNNAILIEAGSREFEMVRDLVAQLDQAPEQVLIEVVIAELSLNEELDWGFEMASLEMPSKVGDTTVQGASRLGEGVDSVMSAVQQGLFPRGLTIGVAHGTRLDAAGNLVVSFPAMLNFNAMRKDGRFRILSSVPLLSQNNQEASVSVVNNIPILKSTIAGGTGTARDVIRNIERIDVGIKLKLTPHVNADGEVRMVLNPSIEAIIDQGPPGQFAPTIARREVSTTVTVPDGETIVITGLMREDSTQIERRVPVLGSIPLLGYLFRHSVRGSDRTNLMIFVTPRVVGRGQSAEALTGEWREKTGLNPDRIDHR